MKRIYNYYSANTGRQYEIKRITGGWLLSNWSHGGLQIASKKSELVYALWNVYDIASMDGDGRICDADGHTALPVITEP